MFQNINENTIDTREYEREDKKRKKLNIFSNVFSVRYIPIYIISLMISMVGISDQFAPFGISVVAAGLGNSIPILGILISGLIGYAIKFGVEGALTYLLTSLVLIASIFVIRPKYNEEERNEKIRLAKNVFISTLLIQIVKIGLTGFTIYDVLYSISFAMIAIVFYKIFVNSINVIQDFTEKRAFSIEEVLGASLILAIAVSAFGDFSILGFSIRNILSILIVLVLGWKNGVLVGTTAGVTIGVTIGVITSSDPVTVAAYAISGMVAGILNRFGRIGVVIGFCLGNVVLAYVSNGYTVELIHFKEILIASIGLLAVPKTMKIDIEEFTGNSKFLPIFPARALNRSKEAVDNLNNVSETVKQMANSYEKEAEEENEEVEKENNKQIFISELLDNLSGYENNMLYDDLSDVDGNIVNMIFEVLIDKQEITREDLLQIFAKCNSYIVGFDDKKISQYLEDNIIQMIRVINMSYKISKSNFVWMKRLKENKKNMKTQLDGVSKAISNIAQNIEQDIKEEEKFEKEKKEIIELLKQKDIEVKEISIKQKDRFLVEIYFENPITNNYNIMEKILTDVLKEKIVINEDASVGNKLSFLSDDKYAMAIGVATANKNKNDTSGDNILKVRLKDGKYLVALSDGMGTGKEANESSSKALSMLENLLLSGFDKENSIELINTSLINQNEESFATLDIAIVDLYKGNIEFIKSGACPTYIKNKNKVQILKANSLPTGIVNESNLQIMDKDIQNGDIMLLCSDGILDSNVEYKNKELWIKYLLEDIETNNTKKIADLVLNEAIDNNFGKAKDDMTLIVCRFLKKD